MKGLLCVGLLATCLHAAAQPATDLLTLYGQARANNPALREAAALAGAADAGADSARAALLPQWTVAVAPARSAGVTTNTATSRISQVLVDLAALASWQAAREDAGAQQASLRAAEQALLAAVTERYFALLTAQNRLATLAANEAAYAEVLRQSEVRVAERLSAPVDVDQARAFLGLAQVATMQAREGVADAGQALQELTGAVPAPLRPLRQAFQPAALRPADPAAWVAAAIDGHPLLRAGDASVAAAQKRYDAARAEHLPKVGITSTTQRAPIDGLAGGPRRTGSAIGLQLDIPLFAGGGAMARQKQALYTRDVEAAQLESARRAIVRSVEAQWQAAQGTVTQIAMAEAAALAAERALAATRAGHQLGTRTLTDVLDAIQTHGEARLQLSQARHRHVVALLLLKQAAGRLNVDDLAGVNALLAPDGP